MWKSINLLYVNTIRHLAKSMHFSEKNPPKPNCSLQKTKEDTTVNLQIICTILSKLFHIVNMLSADKPRVECPVFTSFFFLHIFIVILTFHNFPCLHINH